MKIFEQTVYQLEPHVSSEFQARFKRSPTHAAKLQLLGNLLKEHDLLRPIAQYTPDRKANAKAAEFRLEGNKHMQSAVGARRKLLHAAEAYNGALAYAEPNSEEMAKAYGNRSAVCHALQEYRLALESIELAFANGTCDETLRGRLNARKEACEQMLAGQSPLDEPEPEYYEARIEGDPKMPRVVEGIMLQKDAYQGRHLIATRDFAAGEILMIDEPYAVVWHGSTPENYKRCHHCLRMRILQLLPCPDCVAVMFCSKDCATAARPYHRFECSVLQKLWDVHETYLMNAPRLVCLAIDAFDDDLERLEEHIEQIDLNFTAFQLDWASATPQDLYDTVHVLATNEKKRDTMGNIIMALKGYLMAETMLLHSPEIKRLATDDQKKNFVRALTYHHVMCAYVNMRFHTSDNGQPTYPFISLINHCCVGNTTCLPIAGSRKAIIAHRQIKAGQQITYSYGVESYATAKSERQQFLRDRFQFVCRCEACLGNYPIVPFTWDDENFSVEDSRSLDRIESILDGLGGLHAATKTDLLGSLNEMMVKYSKLMTRKCISRLTSMWSRCLSALYNEPRLEDKYGKLSQF